jgi:hypothetical protein
MTDTSTSTEQTDGSQQTPDTGSSDGFPANTPVAEMEPAQQAAYWKHQSRKHEGRASAFNGGLTAAEAQALQERIAAFEQEKLTDQERAVATAAEQARADARAEAERELLPKLQEMQVRTYAATILSKDQLQAWVPTVNLQAFVGEAGEVDEEKVMGTLTAIFGEPQHQQRDWGQFRNGDRRATPGESGRAEAERRFGTK